MHDSRSSMRGLATFLVAYVLCFSLASYGQAASGFQPDFLAARTFTLVPTVLNIGGNPRSIALGDFNGDGKSDMAVANYSSPTVSVIMANGDGTFGLPTRHSVGSFPRFVLTRDFNGDGKLDLAVVNSNSHPGLSMLLGDGMGGFSSATGFSTGTSSSYAAAADFNRDGKLDLAVANFGSNNVSLLLGDGSGNFLSSTSVAVGLNPVSVATGDFNGDLNPDLAVTNFNSGNIQVLLGSGSGSFGAPLSFVTGVNPIHVAVSDLNGDGKLDMVVANLTANSISVYIGNGAGAFATPTNYPADQRPSFIAIADLNGDGKLDLAVGADTTNTISILLGDGVGNFTIARSVQAGPIPQAIVVDDINGDGRADLAIAHSNAPYVWILLGRGDGSFLTAPGFPTDSPAYAVVIGDFNSDGKADVATANGGNTTSVLLGDGTGSFGSPATYGVGSDPRSLATGDYNNDGKLDLVVGNATDVSILLGNGTGSFGPATNFSVGGFPASVATGDFNGDGKPDIVVAASEFSLNPADVTILLGNGVGGFSAPIRLTARSEPRSVVATDFNHDGKSDIAMTSGSYVSIIMGSGTGNFGPATSYLMTSNDGTSSAAYGLTLGDFNGDLKLDLAVAIAGNVSVLSGNGDGTFGVRKNSDGLGNAVVAGDFDGDGKSDVAMTNGTVSVLSGTGNSSFDMRSDFAAGAAPTSLAVGDLNGDSKPDLVVTDAYQSKVFILLNQTGSPGPANLQYGSGNYSIAEGDVGGSITVTRSGDTSTTVSVNYSLSDLSAQQQRDYTSLAGTLTFAPGETSKTFSVLVVDDAYMEGNETLSLALNNLRGNVVLGSPGTAMLTIVDNDSAAPTTNPYDDSQFFVRQHYYDFLSREPDPSGFGFWTGQITQCGNDLVCLRNKRIDVSNAFFYELEFQQTGAYVYRLYRAAFGNNQPFSNPDPAGVPVEKNKLLSYDAFVRDRARVVGGASLAEAQLDLANGFVQRPEFLAKYPAILGGPAFVDAVLATINNDIGIDLTPQRTALIALYNSGGRGTVMYRLADDNTQSNPINNRAFIDAEYNRAFVATQYFGYLRRDPDMSGFLFWLGQVNSAPLRDVMKQHAMVCSFTTSAEYQQRFSSVVTHTNSECQ